MFRPYIWAIFRLWLDFRSSYTRCMGCSFRLVGVGWGERDLIVTLVGTMTYSYYKWINISCLCIYLMLWICYIGWNIVVFDCMCNTQKILCYWTNTTGMTRLKNTHIHILWKAKCFSLYQQLLERVTHYLQYSTVYDLVLYCDDDDVCVCVCVRVYYVRMCMIQIMRVA
jgi:hypothetical protein